MLLKNLSCLIVSMCKGWTACIEHYKCPGRCGRIAIATELESSWIVHWAEYGYWNRIHISTKKSKKWILASPLLVNTILLCITYLTCHQSLMRTETCSSVRWVWQAQVGIQCFQFFKILLSQITLANVAKEWRSFLIHVIPEERYQESCTFD